MHSPMAPGAPMPGAPMPGATAPGAVMAPAPAPTMTVTDILTRVRERWVLAAAPVLIGLVAAGAYTVLTPPLYVSTASVVVQPLLAEQFGNINLSSVINMSTEAQVAASSAVAGKAGEKLSLSSDAVRASLSVDSPQGTQVLNIRYRAGTAAAAAAGAQTVADSYLAYREGSAEADADRRLVSIAAQIETVNARIAAGGGQTTAYQEALRSLLTDQRELTSIKATAGGRVITSAEPPPSRSAPRPVVDLAVGLAGGAILGLVLSVLWPRGRRDPAPPGEASPGRGAADPAAHPALARATRPVPHVPPARTEHPAPPPGRSPGSGRGLPLVRDRTDPRTPPAPPTHPNGGGPGGPGITGR